MTLKIPKKMISFPSHPILSKTKGKIASNSHINSKIIALLINTLSTEGSFLIKMRMSLNGTVLKNKVNFPPNKMYTL